MKIPPDVVEILGFILFAIGVTACVAAAALVSTTLALVAAGAALILIGVAVLGAVLMVKAAPNPPPLVDEESKEVDYHGL